MFEYYTDTQSSIQIMIEQKQLQNLEYFPIFGKHDSK
jgi:hypothetical protein